MRFWRKNDGFGSGPIARTLAVLIGLAVTNAAIAAEEKAVKAVFLLNFLRYVEWPPSTFSSSNAPLVIGLLGGDPFAGTLDKAVTGESAGGRKVIVKRFESETAAKECQLLFISPRLKGRMGEITSKLGSAPVLTVSDVDGFLEAGGMIQLYTGPDKKVRIMIQIDQVRTAGLIMSSKLLRLAEVRGKSGKARGGGPAPWFEAEILLASEVEISKNWCA